MILSAFAAGAFVTGVAVKSAYNYHSHNDMFELMKQSLWEAGLYRESKDRKGNKTTKECRIKHITKKEYGYEFVILLPIGVTVTDLRKKLEVLQLAFDGEIDIRTNGREITLKIGQVILEDVMPLTDEMIQGIKGLKIPLFTHFGIEYINLMNELGFHIMMGGSSGMGKTKLLDLILCLIVYLTKGKANIHIVNTKMVDLNAYEDVQNVKIYFEKEDAYKAAKSIRMELERRKKILYAAGAEKVSEYKGKEYLPPIFFVIDEFGSFDGKEDKDFLDDCIYISEKGRAFEIHSIYCTQRPDADVFPPRIKQNCITKVGFKTATASNSRVILEVDDAYYLDPIRGRAIVQSAYMRTVQVPFLPRNKMDELLSPYRKGKKSDDQKGNVTTKNIEITDNDSDLLNPTDR